MGNKQRKVAGPPSPRDNGQSSAVLSLPEALVALPEQLEHPIDPTLKISSFSRLAEWKKVKSGPVPFPACYDAVLFTDQSTLFVIPGSTEKGTKSVKQYFGYDFEHKNWYVVDLDATLPAIALGVRVGATLYFFSATKNTLLSYDTAAHQLATTPLPFESTRQLLSVLHVQGELYLFHAESDTDDFSAAEVYTIDAQTWTTRKLGAVQPPARSGFATAVLGECIYLYGGFRAQQGYQSDLWCLDTVHCAWQQIVTTGSPVGCAGHSLAALHINGQPYLVAFGGYNGHYLNSAQLLNLHTREWEVFTCQPVNGDNTIGPRTGASAIVIHDNLYVVGGYNGPYYNDVYVLRPRALSLKLLCFEYLHRNAKHFSGLSDQLPSDLYEEYQRFL